MSNAYSTHKGNGKVADTMPPERSPMDSRQKREAAAYIASLLAGLRQIADGAQLEKLVSALDNAFYEAFTLTHTKLSAVEPADEKSPETKAVEHS